MNVPSSLFKPFTSDKLTLPNRIVMAPMTRGFSPSGVPGPDVADYYRLRAAGGVGLIITEGTGINHPSSVSGENIPLFMEKKRCKDGRMWSRLFTMPAGK